MSKELPIEINVTAEPGMDGKTPIKGVDYFTQEEQKAFVDDIMSRIRVPEDGKDAIVDYSRLEAFIATEVAKIPKPEKVESIEVDTESIVAEVLKKIPEQPEIVVDYESLKKFCLEEIQKIEDSRESRVRQLHSGGPSTRLNEISDVDADNATSGQVLSYNGSRWVPITISSFTSPLTTKGDIYGFSTVDARIPVGSDNQVLTADSTQALGVKWATPTGGTPGGSNTQVQFNDSGAFGGDAGLTYNKTIGVLTIGSAVKAGVGLAYLGDGLGTATPTNFSTLNLQNNVDGSGEYGTIFGANDDTDPILYFNNLDFSGSFDFYNGNLAVFLGKIDANGISSQNGFIDASQSAYSGGLLFMNPSGTGRYTVDSSNLFWNDTNNRLSIGCADAVDTLKVKGLGTGYVSIGQMTGYTSAGSITFNATSSIGGYHLASDNSGDLLINRPSAKIIYFRANNSTQMYISAAGILTIGGHPYWDSTYAQKLNIGSSNTGDDKWGSRFEHINTSTGFRHSAIYAQTQVTATNGYTGSLVNSALRLEASLNSVNIINGSVAGFVSSITCGDNSYGSGTRVTMNNGYVAYLQSPFLYGASVITNMYGFYVAAQKITGVTNGWAVYSEGASDSSYIAGNIGIGTSTISAKLHVLSTTEQLRLGYDASNYYSTTVGLTGGVTFNAVGSGAGFTFSDAVTINGLLTLSAQNIATDTTTGMKIGTATSQKLGFWNTTPIIQPTTSIDPATFDANAGSTTVYTESTFDGYTINQVVKALRNVGLLT